MALKTLPSISANFVSILLIMCVHVTVTVKIQPGIFHLDFMDYLSTTAEKPIDEKNPSLPSLTQAKYYHAVMKSLFDGTPVRISIEPPEPETTKGDPQKDSTVDAVYSVGWEIRYTQCEGLYGNTAEVGPNEFIQKLYSQPNFTFPVEEYIRVQGKEDDPSEKRTMDDQAEKPFPKLLEDVNGTCYARKDTIKNKYRGCFEGEYPKEDDIGKENGNDVPTGSGDGSKNGDDQGSQRRKREEPKQVDNGNGKQDDDGDGKQDDNGDGTDKPTDSGNQEEECKDCVAKTAEAGNHLVIIQLYVKEGSMKYFKVKVEMKGSHGYLSAFQYPLLQFYGIMCGLYILMGFTWLFLLCYQYKDLLGIQIWIGAVIFLGLVEKAVFFAEFEYVNNHGTESQTGVLFPELVSCLKRTLARLLVVVVSIGYGITRPRLGNDLNYIMAAGLLYMVLSSAEAIIRTSNEYDHSVAAILPLSVLDAVLVWWIFRNLVDTTRTLRLRQNEVKLWLYRHFTNTLLLCIVLSVIFFLWSLKTHSFNECIVKWHELWLDDAFWHILFCVILVAVMVLFRPSINNQRYAYSPLLDDEENQDEGSKEPMLSEAYDGMKMRNLKKDSPQNAVNEIDDDLKWVEDNIPAAIADSALSMMDDSEEELVTNLERSKMD